MYQGSIAEKSVLQKLNQGVTRKCAEYHLRGSFFGTFLDKQKSTYKFMLLDKMKTFRQQPNALTLINLKPRLLNNHCF